MKISVLRALDQNYYFSAVSRPQPYQITTHHQLTLHLLFLTSAVSTFIEYRLTLSHRRHECHAFPTMQQQQQQQQHHHHQQQAHDYLPSKRRRYNKAYMVSKRLGVAREWIELPATASDDEVQARADMLRNTMMDYDDVYE